MFIVKDSLWKTYLYLQSKKTVYRKNSDVLKDCEIIAMNRNKIQNTRYKMNIKQIKELNISSNRSEKKQKICGKKLNFVEKNYFVAKIGKWWGL